MKSLTGHLFGQAFIDRRFICPKWVVMLSALLVDYYGVLTDPDRDELLHSLVVLRERGFRTALVSNADSGQGVRDRFLSFFDKQIFSGEVGMAKPDEGIYRLAAKELTVPAKECVFVDDSSSYVAGAVSVGMTGIRHHSISETVREIDTLFNLSSN
jgi:FMN phosphatase YigB (HAD superfamily)